ncbi:MAG TPA: hypothetical protein VF395_14355, partial [Polyangiaceae bacterium]
DRMKFVTSFVALGLVVAVSSVAKAQNAPYGAQQQPQGEPMQAGGLAPPSGSSTDQESAQTEQRLDDADKKDSGRGLEWFYVNAEAGFEHLGLQTFKTGLLVDPKIVSTTQTGGLIGAGLGLRLVFLTIGPRFRVGLFSDYQVWTLDAEVGLRIPLGSLEPYLNLSGGYASTGAFSAHNIGGPTSGDVSITGYDIRAGGGLDIYVTPVFSIGAGLTGEMLGLTRPGVSPSKLGTSAANNLYAASGSSVGFGLTGTAVFGLHF